MRYVPVSLIHLYIGTLKCDVPTVRGVATARNTRGSGTRRNVKILICSGKYPDNYFEIE